MKTRAGRVAVVTACTLLAGDCSRTVTVVVPPSSPSPVVSSPSSALSFKCVTGWYTWYPWGNGPDGFYPFVPQSPSAAASGQHAMGGYQLTATNTSGSTVEMSGFVTALYGAGGNELGSDSRAVQSLYITPGQSFTFTCATSLMYSGGTGAVDESATCSLVSWD